MVVLGGGRFLMSVAPLYGEGASNAMSGGVGAGPPIECIAKFGVGFGRQLWPGFPL